MARRVYTEEYKRDALDLMKRNGSLKGTARELGIADRTLRRWARQYEKPTSASELKRVETMEKDEIIRSRDKKIRELERKVEFLTETMAFFAKRETSEVSV